MLFDKLIIQEADAIQLIMDSLKVESHLNLTYINQHCFNIYNRNSEYKSLLDNNFTVFLDGFGIYAALKFLGYEEVQKFNATDLYEKIFQQFSVNQTKLFLIGGNFSEKFISEKTKEKNLNFCGYQNGYYDNEEINKIIEKIENASADVIVIGIGVPKQEQLAERISDKSPKKIILCVGGFLEFYFETKKRAPKFLTKIGFEWIHRLIKEPNRLWKRYMLGIPVFLFQIIKLKFSTRKDKL